jgi:peroxiredoxin
VGIGQTAPDFEAISLDGETYRLSQFRGQPVLLCFGATWCPDCRRELPLIQQAAVAHPALVILLVDSGEDASLVRSFATEFQLTFPVLLDLEEEIAANYSIYAVPTVFALDENGIIQAVFLETFNQDQLEEAIQKAEAP